MQAKTFSGGIHPSGNKALTEHLPLEQMPTPKLILLPLAQHLGKQAKPIVKKGVEVAAGTLIAEADGFISAPVHSSIAGAVVSISKEPHPGGFPRETIIINSNGKDEKFLFPPSDTESISADEIRQRVAEAGIVGQGGAAFPTAVKLNPPKDVKIDAVILNGCECEPYLTRDFRLMVEKPEGIIGGLKLIMKALGVEKGVIGIEDNKPEAISILSKLTASENKIEVAAVKTKYPQGAEKMLIKAVTGREVPPGKLPLDVGIVIQNIGTALAIWNAVVKGEPLITASITVTGKGIVTPKNLVVFVGTPLLDVLEYCGGLKEDAEKIIVGGPMMGVAQYDLSVPIMKATSGIVVLTHSEVKRNSETPCLRCGQCIEACPIHLVPTKLARYAQLKRFEDAEKLGITVCMECGTCAFTCPANIPLVQWIRLGKQTVLKLQREGELKQTV